LSDGYRARPIYIEFLVSFEQFALRSVRQLVLSFSLPRELCCFISLTSKFRKANVLGFKKVLQTTYKVPKMATMSSDLPPTPSTNDAAPRPLLLPRGQAEVVRAVIEAADGLGNLG
jgi:hypothetical protein